MWNHAIRQVTQHSLRNFLLFIFAALLLLAAAPALAQTDTPVPATNTPTPTATVAPAPLDLCYFYMVWGNDPQYPSEYDGKHLYHKFPENNHMAGGEAHPNFTDPNCENKADWVKFWATYGGFALASDRDTAWDICIANNANRVTDITPSGQSRYWCLTSHEPAPPGGQTTRFLRVGYVGPSAPPYDPLTADEALAECQATWPNVNSVVYHSPGPLPGTWQCLISWTVEATPTPDPNGNSGSKAVIEELIVFGHGFGRTADAGLAECQRKWPDTDAISRHPKLEKYWACLKSQTDQSETPTPTATATATATETSTSTATPTDTPTATATVAPAPDYTCVFHYVYDLSHNFPTEYDGTALYLKFPENDFLSGDLTHPQYTDPNCENQADWIVHAGTFGGVVLAKDLDTGWDLCVANNRNTITDITPSLGRGYMCFTNYQPAPPNGQTERFHRLGYAWPSPPDNEPLTAAEALAECQATWSYANSVAYQWSAPLPGSWICQASWTVQATATPDPNGNSGPEPKADELIRFGHGFGRTADAGLAECQRKWSDTDAIARHPKLEKYWACMGSQTEEVEAPGRAFDLSATVSGGSVSLTWDAPADGGAVSAYRILRRLPDQGEQNMAVLVDNTGSASTSYLDSSAVAGQRHVYRVQALNGGGEGTVSLPAQISFEPEATVAPTNTPIPPTDTPVPTATGAPFTCVHHTTDQGVKLYLKYPASNHLIGVQQHYSDSACETDANYTVNLLEGGMVIADDGDEAWETCQANHTNKITSILGPLSTNGVEYTCQVGDEPAPPAAPTERYLWSGALGSGSTASEGLADCRRLDASIVAVTEHTTDLPGTWWRCLIRWTVGATATETASATPTATASATPTATSTATPTSTSTPTATATDTPTATATSTPTATATSTATATDTPTPAPKRGCVQVGPTTYWLFPASNFLSGTITVHDSDQCDASGTTQSIGADGYVYTSDGQSAAETLCGAGHASGAYSAQQQAFNTDLYACQFLPPTDTPIPPTATPLPPTSTPIPTDTAVAPVNTPASAPGRAHSLSAQPSGGSVALSWSAPVDGSQISGYRILRRLPQMGETGLRVIVDNTGSGATSYVDSSAVAGQKHVYRVQALNSAGQGEVSLPAQIVAKAAPSNTPIPPTATPIPTNTPVPPTDTPIPPTNTAIPTNTAVPPTNTPIPPTNTPVPTSTPIPPTNTPVPSNTPIPQQPGRAHSLSAQPSGGSVNLSWSAPDDGGQVSGYRIWRRLPNKGEKNLGVLADNTGSASTSYTDSSAEAGQKHVYRVQALGPGGEGQNSKPAQIVLSG